MLTSLRDEMLEELKRLKAVMRGDDKLNPSVLGFRRSVVEFAEAVIKLITEQTKQEQKEKEQFSKIKEIVNRWENGKCFSCGQSFFSSSKFNENIKCMCGLEIPRGQESTTYFMHISNILSDSKKYNIYGVE